MSYKCSPFRGANRLGRLKIIILFYAHNVTPLTTLEPPRPPDIPRTTIICGTPRPTRDITVNNMSSPGKAIPGIAKSLQNQVKLTTQES